MVHVLGRAYDPKRDAVETLRDVTLRVDPDSLGVSGCRRARVASPDAPPFDAPVENGRVRLGSVGLWSLVHLTPWNSPRGDLDAS